MKGGVLGIDTSCYATSCALMSLDGQVLANQKRMLSVDMGERGLRQSEAVFQHLRQLPLVLAYCFQAAGPMQLLAVAASSKPLDKPDSYMPVFVAGASFASAIATAQGLPCYATSHQQGHFSAARLEQESLPARIAGIHLSGGTCQLVLIEGDRLQLLADTRDLSAGQLLDRLGVRLGLSFPAGAGMEQLAKGRVASGCYPSSVKEGQVSFSGVEAAALRDLDQGLLDGPQLASELFDVIKRSLGKMIIYAQEQTKVWNVLITGGVAASSLLKGSLTRHMAKRAKGIRLHFSRPEYAGDNAAGVAAIALEQYKQQEEK